MRQFIFSEICQKFLLKNSLDLIDALILQYIIEFVHSGHCKCKIEDQVQWWWVNPNKILNDLPILRLGERSLRTRLKTLEDKNCFLRKNFNREMYFTFTREQLITMYYEEDNEI